MDSKNLTIGVLSTTAVILLVGLLAVGPRPMPVYADGMTATAGDYVVTVGGVTTRDEEYLYVLDTSLSVIVSYRFDNRGQIEMVQRIDLSDLQPARDASGRPATP